MRPAPEKQPLKAALNELVAGNWCSFKTLMSEIFDSSNNTSQDEVTGSLENYFQKELLAINPKDYSDYIHALDNFVNANLEAEKSALNDTRFEMEEALISTGQAHYGEGACLEVLEQSSEVPEKVKHPAELQKRQSQTDPKNYFATAAAAMLISLLQVALKKTIEEFNKNGFDIFKKALDDLVEKDDPAAFEAFANQIEALVEQLLANDTNKPQNEQTLASYDKIRLLLTPLVNKLNLLDSIDKATVGRFQTELNSTFKQLFNEKNNLGSIKKYHIYIVALGKLADSIASRKNATFTLTQKIIFILSGGQHNLLSTVSMKQHNLKQAQERKERERQQKEKQEKSKRLQEKKQQQEQENNMIDYINGLTPEKQKHYREKLKAICKECLVDLLFDIKECREEKPGSFIMNILDFNDLVERGEFINDANKLPLALNVRCLSMDRRIINEYNRQSQEIQSLCNQYNIVKSLYDILAKEDYRTIAQKVTLFNSKAKVLERDQTIKPRSSIKAFFENIKKFFSKLFSKNKKVNMCMLFSCKSPAQNALQQALKCTGGITPPSSKKVATAA